MLTIKVESIAGDDIRSAMKEMKRLSKQLMVAVENSFNGVRIISFPHTTDFSVEDAYKKFGEEVRKEKGFMSI